MTPKDYLAVVTLVLAAFTTGLNIWDRRRHYRWEKERFTADIAKELLGSSSFLEEKYKHYKSVMARLSNVMALLVPSYERSCVPDISLTQARLSEVIVELRLNPLVVPSEVHKQITRVLSVEAARLLEDLEEVNDPKAGRASINRLIGLIDRMKTLLEDDFAKTFSLLERARQSEGVRPTRGLKRTPDGAA